MNNGNRIPTPWKHQWRRFRYSVMPAISFGLCLIVTLWLSGGQTVQPNLTGEINIERIDIAVGIDGMMVDGDVAMELFQNVAKDLAFYAETSRHGHFVNLLTSQGLQAVLAIEGRETHWRRAGLESRRAWCGLPRRQLCGCRGRW